MKNGRVLQKCSMGDRQSRAGQVETIEKHGGMSATQEKRQRFHNETIVPDEGFKNGLYMDEECRQARPIGIAET